MSDAGTAASRTPDPPGRLLTTYRGAVFTAALVLLMLDIPVFLYVSELGPAPKFAFAAIALLSVPIVFCSAWSRVLAEAKPYCLVVAFFLAVVFVVWLTAPRNVPSAVATQALTCVFSLCLAFIAGAVPVRQKAWAIRVVAMAAVVLLILSFVRPDAFLARELPGAVIGRASAFWVNPNRAGEAVLILSLLVIASGGRRLVLPVLLIAGACLVLTFSRGALLTWGLLVFLAAILGLIPRVAIVLPGALLAALIPIGVLFSEHLVGAMRLEEGEANITERIEGLTRFEMLDHAALERKEALQIGLAAFWQHPLTGQGIGSIEDATGILPHNQIVYMLGEYGPFGALAFLSLVAVIGFARRERSFPVKMIVVAAVMSLSLFTHDMLDAMYWVMGSILLSQRLSEEAVHDG